MPVNVSWLEPGIILQNEYIGKVALDEVLAAVEKDTAEIASAPGIVHILVDLRRVQGLPLIQYNRVEALMDFLNHAKLGWLAIVGMHPVVDFWAKLLIKQMQLRYNAFTTFEEADIFLREVHRIHYTKKR